MKSLFHARLRARELRSVIGSDADDLLARLCAFIESEHGVELIPVPAAVIDEGRAEISPAERALNYDERLTRNPGALMWTLAHELGHLTLHQRLTKPFAQPDPLLGSVYLNEGAAGIARYSRHAREEAEANAFATEFISPASDVFTEWRATPDATSHSIAARRGIPEHIVRAQLGEALAGEIQPEQISEAGQTPRKPPGSDPQQMEAAVFTGAPALVTAGPGTGKTATLVRRIEYLIAEQGARAAQFLVLTFSNDAAGELRERIAARFGLGVANEMEIATFHGFGLSFLHHHALELDPDTKILDEAGQDDIITTLLGTLRAPHIVNLRDTEDTVRRIRRHINHLKDRVIVDETGEHNITPEVFAAEIERWPDTDEDKPRKQQARELLAFFRGYEAEKTARAAVDFADLIALPIRVMQARPELVAAARAKYRFVLVDEYQDVSRTVALLLKQLCGPDNPPWVVGDLRQAIYRFRGAAPENVLRFTEDFPGGRVFELATNYRSCADVVTAANQLATLMAAPEHDTDEVNELWRAGTALTNVGDVAVSIARANADAAEYDGIASQARAWLDQDVPPGDIAVLARRNVDVRNIVLALGQRGIKATTSGMITPEGAAGDLAALVTFGDQPAASLPRLAWALGRGVYDNATINAAIEQAMREIAAKAPVTGTDGLPGELRRLQDCFLKEHHGGDAFSLMLAFLFNGSDYLRRALDLPEATPRALTLSEIITTLSRAAGWRYAHPQLKPIESRLRFAQHFRDNIGSAKPSVDAPRAGADAVRVMTCHASKGLEFPCVVVAGQTLTSGRDDWWIPESLQPSAEDERAQADALLFVGVTRAKRALVVSSAETKSGSERARSRQNTALLDRWQSVYGVPVIAWPRMETQRETVTLESLWGGAKPMRLAAGSLDDSSCGIRVYLESWLNIRFPEADKSLYPPFYTGLRLSLSRIIEQAQGSGERLPAAAARVLFDQAFADTKLVEHQHYTLFQEAGAEYAVRFAAEYKPDPRAMEYYDAAELLDRYREEAGASAMLPLRFDFVSCYRAADGSMPMIVFRPESMAKNAAKNSPRELNWSGLKSTQRLAFVLLRNVIPELEPLVFSAADGILYKLRWSARASSMTTEHERLQERWRAYSARKFETKLSEHACNRCPARLSCPHWLNVL
ncbi:MAG: UvrD-helicase domain-containing protein [Blastocatellia bacterium]